MKSISAINAQQAIVGSSNWLSVDYSKRLRHLEYELRSRDHHVYYDADHGDLWVFGLPKLGSTSIQRSIENEEILHITAQFEAKSMYRIGFLRIRFNSSIRIIVRFFEGI